MEGSLERIYACMTGWLGDCLGKLLGGGCSGMEGCCQSRFHKRAIVTWNLQSAL